MGYSTQFGRKKLTLGDWSRGLIINLPKKGDLTSCGNWRGIALMSIVAKVLRRGPIQMIVARTDAELRREQAGSRKGRSITEQIFVVRNIVEQIVEWNSSLYLCYADYEKAFDSKKRDILCENHEMLWNTTEDCENGTSHVQLLHKCGGEWQWKNRLV